MATTKTNKKASEAVTIKTNDELSSELIAAQTELVEVKRSHATRELANTQRIKELRRQIARLKTALVQAANKEEKA